MKKENWLIQTKVNIEPFVTAIDKCTNIEDVSGNTSAQGPNTIQYNYWENKQYYEKEIRNVLNNIINEYPKYKDKIQLNKLEMAGLWTVEGKENSYHRIHRHDFNRGLDEHIRYENCISTVLYVNVPDKDPKGEFYCLLEKEHDTILRCFKPEVGDLYIFPCTTYHGVYPQGPGLRKTINCDLYYNSTL